MMPLAIPGGKRDSKLDLETGPAIVTQIPSDPADARPVQEENERALKAHHFPEPKIFWLGNAVLQQPRDAGVDSCEHNALGRDGGRNELFRRFEVAIDTDAIVDQSGRL